MPVKPETDFDSSVKPAVFAFASLRKMSIMRCKETKNEWIEKKAKKSHLFSKIQTTQNE